MESFIDTCMVYDLSALIRIGKSPRKHLPASVSQKQNYSIGVKTALKDDYKVQTVRNC